MCHAIELLSRLRRKWQCMWWCWNIEHSGGEYSIGLAPPNIFYAYFLFLTFSDFFDILQPNGCGCKPNSFSPCTYNKEWGGDDKCFICTAQDLARGDCQECKACIANCPKGDCVNESLSTDDLASCLNKVSDAECRASCHSQCLKVWIHVTYKIMPLLRQFLQSSL